MEEFSYILSFQFVRYQICREFQTMIITVIIHNVCHGLESRVGGSNEDVVVTEAEHASIYSVYSAAEPTSL